LILEVSIPQSGFLVVTLSNKNGHTLGKAGFNPSVGILGGHTAEASRHCLGTAKFQSLSRDSWWSHPRHSASRPQPRKSFNPSVGILGGHTAPQREQAPTEEKFQSLSRDSWWSHQAAHQPPRPARAGFQSLSRDSWWSHPRHSASRRDHRRFQSLSRDSWWSHPDGRHYVGTLVRGFNPSVGILGGHTSEVATRPAD